MKNIKNSTKKSNQGEKMMNKVNSTEKSNQGEKMMNRVVNNMKEENKTNMKREGKTGMDKKIRIAAMTTVTAVTGVMIGQPATMAFAAEEQGNVTVTAVDEYSINAAMQNSTKVPDMNELKSVVEVTKKEADDAQTAYDTSKETAQKAFEEAVSKAEAVKNQAETEYKKSETNLTDASSADEQAGQEVEGAKREVEKTTQDLSNAEAGTGVSDADLSAKEEEVAAAKTRVEDAKENIVAAENTNLENLKRSIAIMKKINELRASDDNFTEEMRRNPSCTNFFFMATAEAGAMRGAGLRRHSSLTTSCENLSFNKEDPTLGWYTKEKAIFDRIKNELGITKLTAETLQQIEEEAANQGVVIGHYTNLFWAVDQAMGVGYTQYGMTSCYNASNASNVTDDSYNRGKHLYTVEEFEAILNQYYALTDTESCNQMLETAKSELESAEEEVRNLEDNKDALIEAVIREANEAYQQRANDAQEAQKALNNAEMHVSETKSAYEAAAKNADMLQQNMEAAKESFEKSESADAELEEKISEMQSETDDAYEKVKEAEAAVNAAMQEETVAKESLKEKLELLDKANQVYEDAKKAFQEASANLDNITNGTFVEKIRKEKTAADAELAQAAGVKDEKCKILADKEAEFEAAKNHLAKAKEEYETASTEADSARTAYANAKTEFEQLSSELSSLNESYAPVLTAKTALAEAEEKLEQAYTRKEETAKAYEAAKEYYETAKAAWEEAEDKFDRASKISFEDALTEPVTDEDFIYLNDYVNDFLEKERELAEADDKYKFAKAALEAAQENSKLSDRDYLVDYVSKLVEENNRPSGGVQKLSQTTNSTDKETFSDAGTVKTGDTVKTGGWLAGMLAGAGILAIVGKRKKKEVHYGKAGKNGSKRI